MRLRQILVFRGSYTGWITRPYCSTPYSLSDRDDKIGDRSEQAKGALRDFINKIKSDAEQSPWAKLRQASEPDAKFRTTEKDKPSFSPRRSPTTPIKSSNDVNDNDSDVDLKEPKPKRQLNRRLAPKKKSPVTDDFATRIPGLDDDTEGGGTGGSRGGKSRLQKGGLDFEQSDDLDDGDDFEDGPEDDEYGEGSRRKKRAEDANMIAPEDEQYLTTRYFFEEKVMEGNANIDTSGMDPLDALMAKSFIEAFKTKDGSCDTMVHLHKKRKDVQIPKARNMQNIVNSMKPQISTAVPNTFGFDLAAEVWEEIQKNVYIPDKHKYEMCNYIGTLCNELEEFAKNNEVDDELLFQPWFRKGLTGLEIEHKMKFNAEYKLEDDFDQDDPDWDVEAVADEDEL